MIDCKSLEPGEFTQELRVRAHVLRGDVMPETGGKDTAPGPHDYFDAALASCKVATATWYAKKNGIPLEGVESHVERDASRERDGVYLLKVRLEFRGPLTAEQRTKLYAAVGRCPIHKLMTTTEVQIETEPLAG